MSADSCDVCGGTPVVAVRDLTTFGDEIPERLSRMTLVCDECDPVDRGD